MLPRKAVNFSPWEEEEHLGSVILTQHSLNTTIQVAVTPELRCVVKWPQPPGGRYNVATFSNFATSSSTKTLYPIASFLRKVCRPGHHLCAAAHRSQTWCSRRYVFHREVVTFHHIHFFISIVIDSSSEVLFCCGPPRITNMFNVFFTSMHSFHQLDFSSRLSTT